ncbi:MAG: ComF family protein [Dysgonamonadaceae bacterium]|jgi:ComF family protein|nr:ComF family protein [Dysgonamonadaceae bacterium]
MLQIIKTLIDALLSIIYPDVCCICSKSLVEGEKHICLYCLYKLPQTNYHLRLSNPAEECFRGRFIYQRVSSFFRFEKEGNVQKLVHRIKYKDDEALGVRCGRLMADKMIDSGFFSGIDLIVPVPLHKKKMKKRGYNQSEAIARGVSERCGIPVNNDSLIKFKSNTTQTKKGRYERWLNAMDVFAVLHPETFSGKHVLLIDDVLTTGATLESCARQILTCEDVKISILTLSISR